MHSKRSLLIFLVICYVAAQCSAQTELAAINSLVQNYCVDCHHASEPAAGLDLEDFAVDVSRDHRWDTSNWEAIVRRMRAGQMPPPDADQPSKIEFQLALHEIESALDQHAKKYPRPGRTDAVRRLNRTEYRNAVRDLLAIDVEVNDLLPADQSGHGFDNVTVGELPPMLLSRYINAAEKISRLAIGAPQRGPGGLTVRLPADRTQESHVDGLPLGTRGGVLFDHHFPAAGEYEIELRLMRDRDENIEGLSESHDIDVLIDRDLVHRFSVSPPKVKAGWQRDDTLVDANLKKRFHVTAGPHAVGVTFPRKFSSLSEIRRQPFEPSFNRHRHPRKTPAIFQVSIVGPFDPQDPRGPQDGDTPSRRQILTCTPSDDVDAVDCAQQVLRPILRSAYRRPITQHDLMVPMRFFQQRFAIDGFESGIESALSAVLVNPHFLFRAEKKPDGVSKGDVYQISDIELASRLSFFLWSSIPDEELIALAETNRLHQPDLLDAQVRRMLRDDKSQSLVSNFAAQWLYLRNLDSFRPDMRRFPDFDDNLRHDLRRETELLFQSVLREDRSVLDLIRSDTTFLNERLARHYGVPHVFGSHFRPVTVAADSHRGGLLRHGSVLAVTSYATRTSPTIRGNWILENILGTPPPPPPPNVPSLKEKTSLDNVTVRQRLARHREDPACASCHDLMDPVGFALENFDAVGRWRVFEDGNPIDSSGALPDGTQIDSVDSLEAGIMNRPEMFVATLTEKLLTFALGRGIEAYDGPAIRHIVSDSAVKEFRFSSLISGIARSTPFQQRVAQ